MFCFKIFINIIPAKAPTGVKNAHMFEAKIEAKIGVVERAVVPIVEQVKNTEANNIDIGILFIKFAITKQSNPTSIIDLPLIKFARFEIKPLFCKAKISTDIDNRKGIKL